MTQVKLRALIWCVLALIVVATGVVKFDGNLPVQTNLLSLLPQTERNPVAEDAVGKLAHSSENRAVFLIGHRSPDLALESARVFAASVRASGVFDRIVVDMPPFDARQIAALYAERRFGLLSPLDREPLAQGEPQLDERLMRRLYSPFRAGALSSVSDDPFGLFDNWLAVLPVGGLRLENFEGALIARDGARVWVFVNGELNGSAYDRGVQRRVDSATASAEELAKLVDSDVQLLRTGTVFYAGAARVDAERDIDLIGAGSLVGMLLLLYLVFRSLRPLALGLLSVGFGIAAATVVTVLVQGELHLITLVFGASLIGEAIDYAIQFFAAHLGAGTEWTPMSGLRRIAPGLCIALATSLLGYGVLMLAPFPALSQIALFAFVGLSAAWLTVFLLLPALLISPASRPPGAFIGLMGQLLTVWRSRVSRPAGVALALGILLLSAPGWWWIEGKDDIRLLVSRPKGLVLQEESIRALTGFDQGNQFFLVEGDTVEDALIREEALSERLRERVVRGDLGGFLGVSGFVPSMNRQEDNRSLLAKTVFSDPTGLRQLLERNGFRTALAARWVEAFSNSAHNRMSLDDWLNASMSVPFRHLWLGNTPQGVASVVQLKGLKPGTSLSDVAKGLPGVTWVDKAGSVSRLFSDYRQWGGLWLFVANALVLGVLCLRYGARRAAVIVLPTWLAMCLTLGALGYLGEPFTLFNLMALMLVLGVGVNYAIFLVEVGVSSSAAFAGVLLSAGTTLLSFGLLAFSSMPALAGFGLTLLFGIAAAVCLAPLALTFGGAGR